LIGSDRRRPAKLELAVDTFLSPYSDQPSRSVHEGSAAGSRVAEVPASTRTFEIASADEAERLVADDPFDQEDLLERRWLKEWMLD
jgi:hypothetical protein